LDTKQFIGIVIVVLGFVSYLPYVRDTLNKKSQPHPYTYFVWVLINIITSALQVSGGAGPGAYITISSTLFCFIIFILSLRNGKENIMRFDSLLFSIAMTSAVIWATTDQPVLSLTLLLIADTLAFGPTIRKTWIHPDQETLSTWILWGIRFALSIFAIEKYNFLTLSVPIVWIAILIPFNMMIVFRRKTLSLNSKINKI